MNKKKEQDSWKTAMKKMIYELYTITLMQNQLSFLVWLIFYLISYFQMLDFLFYQFFDSLSDESFLASVILQVFSSCSVPSPPYDILRSVDT